MATAKWEPFQEFLSIQDRMSRLFEQTVARSRDEAAGATWAPAVDIYERPDAIVLQAELPGIAREEIDIQLQDNTLTLRGERRALRETQGERCLRLERTYGVFQRTFALPEGISQDAIRAVLRDGVLEVVVPKPAAGSSTRVEVRVA